MTRPSRDGGDGGIRVLIVDDEPAFAEMVVELLEREDESFDARYETDPRDALERVTLEGVDCVVSDYDMPGMDGLELLDRVREEVPDLPFVLFTGQGSEEVASEAISAGVTDYVQKGAGGAGDRYAVLANRVRNAVEGYRARRKAAATERRRRRTLDRITDGFLAVDADWVYTYVNEEAERLLDRSEEELLGETIWEAFPELVGSPFEEGIRTAMETQETVTVEDYYPPLDSWFDVRMYPADDGLSAYFRDVTDRREDERDLRRYETLVEGMVDAVFMFDAEGTCTFVNEAAAAATSYSREELVGGPLSRMSELGMVDDEAEFADYEETVDRLLAGERETARHSLEVSVGDGVELTIDVHLSRVEDEDGDVLGVVGVARDITEREEHERELEARTRAIEAATDGIAILDEGGTYTYVNRAHAEVYGYDDPSAFVGESWRICYGEDELARMEEEVLRALDEDGSWRGEAVGRRRDGGTFPQELSLTLLDDGRIVCVVRDITERKRREEQLQRQHDRLNALFHAVPHPVVHAVIEGDEPVVLRVNHAFEEVFGYAADAAEGESLDDLVVPDRLGEEARSINRSARDGAAIEREVTRQAVDGEREFLLSVVRLPRGDEDGEGLATYVDISEQKRRQRQLQERKARLEGLYEAAADIGACDAPDAVYERVVAAAEGILDFDIALADAVEDGKLVPRASSSELPEAGYYEETPLDATDNLAARAVRSGEPSVVDDLRRSDVAPADSAYRAALTVPIGEHGVFQAAADEVGSFDDTDRELAELLVSHARETLTRLDRERELERQNDRLEEFASIVAHDLRNPVEVAHSYVELVDRDCESGHLDELVGVLERMDAIIEDTLKLARQGRTTTDERTVVLGNLVAKCWRVVETADADLEVAEDVRLRGDPDRLQHVFENLFRNAVLHGGEDVTVRVGAIDEDGIYVEDDGPGVPETERPSVFETGYTTTDGGTGFGLAIVERIVEAHGWEIRVTDGTGGGARFEVTDVTFE